MVLYKLFQRGWTRGFLPILAWRLVFAAVGFGALMGVFHGVLMAGTSAVKLPLLYVLAVLICLPSFYTRNCLFGSRLRLLQMAVAFACATAVNAMMLAALAKVSLLFLITSGSYGFHKLRNDFFRVVGGLYGIWYFVRAMRTAAEAAGQRLRKGVMFIWLLLYAFAVTQLGWTLRPFFGAPNQPFELFRKVRTGNFYENIIQTISEPRKWPTSPPLAPSSDQEGERLSATGNLWGIPGSDRLRFGFFFLPQGPSPILFCLDAFIFPLIRWWTLVSCQWGNNEFTYSS